MARKYKQKLNAGQLYRHYTDLDGSIILKLEQIAKKEKRSKTSVSHFMLTDSINKYKL